MSVWGPFGGFRRAAVVGTVVFGALVAGGCTAASDVGAARPGCPAVATRAAPKPGKLIVGINSAWNNSCNLSAIRSAGVTMERLEVNWPALEPQRGRWTWGALDKQFSAAARKGISILPVLMEIPSWAGGSAYSVTADQAGFAGYVARVVRRYGQRGSFWRAHRRLPYRPARWFEIWNEPYLPQFADGNPNPSGYARLVKASVIAAHRVQPAARFLLAAEASAQTSSGAIIPWIAPMYRAVRELNRYFDGIAVHPYSAPQGPLEYTRGDTRFQFRRIEGLRREFVARGAGAKPFWITEIGWSTCPSSPGNCNNEWQQAAYLAQTFQKVKRDYAGWVSALIVYNYRDSTADPNPTNKERWFGLIRGDGSPKPAWNVLRAEAR